MMNDINEIKQSLRQTPTLKVDNARKIASINKALEQFDQNFSHTHQGNQLFSRLSHTACAVWQSIFGRENMKKYSVVIVGMFSVLFVGGYFLSLSYDFHTEFFNAADTSEKYSQTSNTKSLIKKQIITDAAIAEFSPGNKSKWTPVQRPGDNKDLTLAKNAPAPSHEPFEASYTAGQPYVGTTLDVMPANANRTTGKSEVLKFDAQLNPYQEQGRDKFQETKANPVKLAKDEPVSTFSVDVDTASYGFMRASLNQNVLPQKNAVRVEEFINYFPYDYPMPANREQPFKTTVAVFPTPWNPDTRLLHIGIKGYQLDSKAKPRANLVFLIDTSGSMNAPNKLPLVQSSLKMLLDTLNEDDTVAIVTYAGNAGIALSPTKLKEKSKIINIIDNLGAAGSTSGAEGIRQAYQLAEEHIDAKGINRVILATDGDFNVGITDINELKSFIERKRTTGVSLSVLGFGMGNYDDQLMQTLAQNGNGNAAYIDNLNEARKALVNEAGSTLFTIAKDVKIQVEFNPLKVTEYRLLGYETRLLNREDFNNDKVDAGDIGAGHSVTALYEITPVGSKAKLLDDLRYQTMTANETQKKNKEQEYGFVKIRYKLPDSDTSKLFTTAVDSKEEYKSLSEVPADSRFVSSVAAFAELLRGDPYLKNFAYDQIIALAENSKGHDKYGYRTEFVNLVRAAKNAPALPTVR